MTIRVLSAADIARETKKRIEAWLKPWKDAGMETFASGISDQPVDLDQPMAKPDFVAADDEGWEDIG